MQTDALTDRLRRHLSRHPRMFRALRRGKVVGRYLLRMPHEPEFRVFPRLADRPGLFLDVGGNSGQSAFSFRLVNRTDPILSVEANPALEHDLRLARRILRGFNYTMCAAGPRNGRTTLYIPRRERVTVTGEASLEQDTAGSLLDGELTSVDEVEVTVRRLDDLGLDPAFVKIDVEADAIDVLEGLRDTLTRSRPVLLIETSDRTSRGFRFLEERGYRPKVLEDGELCDWQPGHHNTIFLPGPAAAS